MRSDARQILNNKKWRSNKNEVWKSQPPVDARKILNLKRQQSKAPQIHGSYMTTKTATALIASKIREELSAVTQVPPNKQVQLSEDGNIIVTSKSRNVPQVLGRREVSPKLNRFSPWNTPVGGVLGRKEVSPKLNRFSPWNTSAGESMQYQSSSNADDLEHTAVEDLMDLESLPSGYVASRSLHNANLSRKSVINEVLDKKHTMVADQLTQYSSQVINKVQVSNLHPTVSKKDVMELFGDIGVIKSIEMEIPGTANIEYFDENDALKACNIYHNRLLDGLPMRCYLNKSSSPQKFALSQRLGNRSEPYVHMHHAAVLPTVVNPRSRYNPRNVQFTVKLT